MKIGKRGEAGFMEAMLAAMVVTVALTGFLGLLAQSALSEPQQDRPDGNEALEGFAVVGGVIVDVAGEGPELPEGIVGMRVTASPVGGIGIIGYAATVGDTVGVRECDVGAVVLDSDDGRRVLVRYEVETWI